MSYEPLMPQGASARVSWAQQLQEAVYRTRRVLRTPDTLTHETTQGVFHRPKAVDEAEEEAGTTGDFFSFAVAWRLMNGTNPLATGSDPMDFNPVQEVGRTDYLDNTSVTEADLTAVLNRVVDRVIYWPQSLVKLPAMSEGSWRMTVGVSQSAYGNDTLTNGDRVPLSLFTLVGLLVRFTAGIPEVGVEPGAEVGELSPLLWYQFKATSYASQGLDFSDAGPPPPKWRGNSAAFADLAVQVGAGEGEAYLMLGWASGRLTDAEGEDSDRFRLYGDKLFPVGVTLALDGVAYKV